MTEQDKKIQDLRRKVDACDDKTEALLQAVRNLVDCIEAFVVEYKKLYYSTEWLSDEDIDREFERMENAARNGDIFL